LMVVLADWLLYRGYGYSGYAAFLAGAPLLLLMGAPLRQWMPSAWVVIAMLVVLIVNLVWSGTGLLVAIGFTLLVAFAMCITGRRPYVSDVGWYACQSIAAGFAGLLRYWASADRFASVIPRSGWTNFMLPAVAVLGFGTLFILANPDVATAVSQALEQFFDSFWERVLAWKPDGGQLLLWIAVAWISIGLLRPVLQNQEIGGGTSGERVTEGVAVISAEAPLYVAYRNMLVALIALFAVLPVDALVHTYNVRRILAGDPAPSVQISVHPIDAAGILILTPLTNCDNEIIREGVRALLAGTADESEWLARQRKQQGWTSFQWSNRVLLDKLVSIESEWQHYTDPDQRDKAIARFVEYAYQWY